MMNGRATSSSLTSSGLLNMNPMVSLLRLIELAFRSCRCKDWKTYQTGWTQSMARVWDLGRLLLKCQILTLETLANFMNYPRDKSTIATKREISIKLFLKEILKDMSYSRIHKTIRVSMEKEDLTSNTSMTNHISSMAVLTKLMVTF